ncbi:helix-turn-helix transcriptional regulator [Pseudoalteromonas pernae]|uniref:helix-turn-helix transcriptional regulator n=1 Tax=Pseudoalteromonas pernae TaxID=3118054 RepID=UPI003242D32A
MADYIEVKPPAWLSPYIEAFWLRKVSGSVSLFPQGVFDLLLHNEPLSYCGINSQNSSLRAGMSLLGQQLYAYHITSSQPQWVLAVRLKPFAFFQQSHIRAYDIKNGCESVNELFISSYNFEPLFTWLNALNDQVDNDEISRGIHLLAPWLQTQFCSSHFALSPTLRAQTNSILDTRGNILISDICQRFDTSKVTLRSHFMSHVGLLPKELCKVWRINHFLLHAANSNLNLTEASYNAGYFDQAHLNREFKSMFGQTPKAFLKSQVVSTPQIASLSIQNRFSGQYDPF